MMARSSAYILALGVILPTTTLSFAQEYPDRPIRVVTSGLGGGTDLLARIVAQGISASFKQPVIVGRVPCSHSAELIPITLSLLLRLGTTSVLTPSGLFEEKSIALSIRFLLALSSSGCA